MLFVLLLAACSAQEPSRDSLQYAPTTPCSLINSVIREGYEPDWCDYDFEYLNATIVQHSGRTFMEARLRSAETRMLDAGYFFDKVIFQDGSATNHLLASCVLGNGQMTKLPCGESTWAYEWQEGDYPKTTRMYCPASDSLCKKIVEYYVEHSYNCGEYPEGVPARCLVEGWDGDLELRDKARRIITAD